MYGSMTCLQMDLALMIKERPSRKTIYRISSNASDIWIRRQTGNAPTSHSWSLSRINKYKEVEYIPVEYPPTSEILADIRRIETEISKEMDELEKLLKSQK